MSNFDKKLNFLERAGSYHKYRKFAKEGNFLEALELNQIAYEFFYEMYTKEKKDEEVKAKIQRALEKIADDGTFIKTQLNNPEES